MTSEDKRICPECQARLVFSGSGLDMICERCGYQRKVGERKERSIDSLMRMRRMLSGTRSSERTMRPVLKQGIGAYHDGHLEAATSYFQQVVLKTGDHEEEMEAWLWLSRLVDDPEEKRACIEAVLAINPASGQARRALAVLDGRIDPDQLLGQKKQEDGPDVPRPAAATRMRCPRCAGEMIFDPEKTLLTCEYCGHTEEAAAPLDVDRDEQFGQGALEQDFDAAIHTVRGHSRPEAVRVMHCQGCTTEFVLSPATLSVTCPYCAAVYVTEAAETAELLPPQAIIPFRLTLDDARGALVDWFKGQGLDRREITPLSPVSGLYIPAWTFDIGGEVQWRGRIERGSPGGGQTAAIPVFNSKYVFFNDTAVLAMAHQGSLFQKLLRSYDFREIAPYDPRLLANWPAERYTVPVADAAAQARGEIGRQVRRLPHGLDGGNDLDQRSVRCRTEGIIIESYKLLLLPLWTFHYRRQGEPFDLLVNGQTGEVLGDDRSSLVKRFVSWLKQD